MTRKLNLFPSGALLNEDVSSSGMQQGDRNSGFRKPCLLDPWQWHIAKPQIFRSLQQVWVLDNLVHSALVKIVFPVFHGEKHSQLSISSSNSCALTPTLDFKGLRYIFQYTRDINILIHLKNLFELNSLCCHERVLLTSI